MRKLTVALLALAMVLALVSCGASAEMKAAAGTYKGTEYKYNADTEWADNSEWTIELKDDGTGVSKREDTEYDAEWTLEGDKFTLTEKFMGMKLEYTGTLKDGKLEFYNGDPSSDLTCLYKFEK